MNLNPVVISRSDLVSEITRNFIGDRIFDSSGAIGESNQGGKLGKFFNGFLKFGSWLLKQAFSFIEWSFSGLWELIVEISYEIAYFDWNQTDAEIEQEIKANNNLILNQLGQFLGSGSVWLASVGVAGALSVKFPVLAGKVALELAQEGGDEIRGQLAGLLSISTSTSIRSALLGSYLGIRRGLRGVQTENRQPWIIARKIEEKVEAISSEGLRNFTEGLLDGFFDAILEVGYVVSFTLDDFYQAQRLATEGSVEPIRTLEVFPDQDSEESIILEDTQENVESQLNTYLGNHELVANRDVGVLVGNTYDDWYTLKPQSRKLTLEFRGKEKPPFVDNDGKQIKRVQIAIPNVKSGVGWNDLKSKVKKFTWGNYLARGVFEDRRQMSVWGASANEAKQTLIQLASLSSKELIQVTVSTPEIQNIKRRKKPTVVYPTHAVMLVRKSTVDKEDYELIDGQNREMVRTRLELWRDEPPDDFTGFL